MIIACSNIQVILFLVLGLIGIFGIFSRAKILREILLFENP